jgi:hypothetical protein
MAAMDDLVTNIDGGAVFFEGQIHNIDRPIDTGAKPTRIGKIDLHGCRSSFGQGLQDGAVNVRVHDTSDLWGPSTELALRSLYSTTE